MTAYLGLGSNLGDRRSNLRSGLVGLDEAGLRILARSSVWETEPVLSPTSDWFLNMVVRVGAELSSPLDLLDVLLAVEDRLGRVRSVPNAPRTIDLDLLLVDELSWSDERLVLPHPRMWDRAFVLAPLTELAPDLCNPRTGRKLGEERRRIQSGGRVRLLGPLS